MQRRIKNSKAIKTPWGTAQIATEVALGIISYSTASHGGYYLSEELNAKVAPALKRATFGGLGLQGWYEEDVDWAIVVYTFKDCFDSERYEAAVQCLKTHHPKVWKLVQAKM